MKFLLRKANISDARNLFNLSNEKSVRENSINQKPIIWDEHLIWLNKKLLDKNYEYFIIEDEYNNFIGQIRYEINNGEALVSISLISDYRGKGLSSEVLIAGTKNIFYLLPEINKIVAFISPVNVVSQKAFIKAGYSFSCEKELIEGTFNLYILERKI